MSATVSTGRRWLYRAVGLLLVPFGLLALVELGLRIAGYGYPTTFLVPRRYQGHDVWVENASFGRLFFPPELARSPTPTLIAAHKPAGTFRILLFGESAALGDPRPAYGMGRYLEVLLQQRFPATHFEVVPVAMTAINSHALRRMAEEATRYGGDVWAVYAGNNEMVGPFGAATIFGPRAPSLAFTRASVALKSTRTGQALAALARRLGGDRTTNAPWSGLKMFVQNQIAPDHPARRRVYEHFDQNLEAIVRAGISAGVPVLLSTVAVNLRDCAPFASLHSSGLDLESRSNFAGWYLAGQTNQAAGKWDQAADAYTKALALDARWAEAQFLSASCLTQLNRGTEARAGFERACEFDALPFRADPSINAIIRNVAARHRQDRVALVESEGQLAASAPAGSPGREFFFEHVHPNFEGNYRLARSLAEAIAPLLPEATRRDGGASWATAPQCDERLGLTEWNRVGTIDMILARISDAPYTNQLTSAAERKALLTERTELRSRMTSEQATNALALYRDALARRPDDFRLHESFAEFLEAVNRFPEAATEWQAVRDLIPHHFAAYVNLGRMLSRQGRLDEARAQLEAGLRMEPRSVEGHLELARVLARQKDWPAAAVEYRAALRLQPSNARAYVQLADVFAQLGKRDAALSALRNAVRVDPSFWEARYLLGVELAMSGQVSEALAEFEAAVRLKPDHALSRLNLGVALMQQGRAYEARREFSETLRLDPTNEKAQRYLDTVDQLLKKVESARGSPISPH